MSRIDLSIGGLARPIARGLRAGRSVLAKCRNDCRGISAVEFAFVAPFLFMAVFGMFEAGRLYWINNTMQFAAEEAARYGMVHETASNADITNAATSEAVGVNPADMVVTIGSDTVSGVSYLTVTTTYQFDFLVPFLPGDLITLTGHSRVPRVF